MEKRSPHLLLCYVHPLQQNTHLLWFSRQASQVGQVNNVMCGVEEVMLQGLMCRDALLRLVLQKLLQQVA